MRKRLPSLIIAGMLIIVSVLAITQHPQGFYPTVEIEVTDPAKPLELSFLLHSRPTLRDCEALTGNIAQAVLKRCPQCRVKNMQCKSALDESRQTLLTDAPLTTASGRVAHGVILFHAADPELALAACQAAETQTAAGNNPVKCYAANTPRTEPAAPSILNPWILVLLLSAFAAAWFAGWLIVKYEHLHAHLSHDHVGSGPQKYHTEPTPRIGGLAVMIGLLAALVTTVLVENASTPNSALPPSALNFGLLLFAGIPTFLGGLVEDITKKVGVLERLLLTMLAGSLAAWLLGAVLDRLDVPGLDQALLWLPFAVAFTIFAASGIANAINIIDGYNGLAGGFAVIVLAALAYVAYLVGDSLVFTVALSLTGALLGFLAWNWPSGKIFLGDGGAYLLGFLLAELSILLVARNPEVSPWFALLLLIYPVFETLFCIYRRKFRHGFSPGQPDNVHLHQLIHDNIVACETGNSLNTNNSVAKYLWMPAIVTALLGVIAWQNTIALITAAISYCVFYVVIYRKIMQRKAMPVGARESRTA